jgi:hypothetical protein
LKTLLASVTFSCSAMLLLISDGRQATPNRGPMMTGPVWYDDLVLSETHYHHGDHHHNHHQRHIHHFHDLHLLGSAEEILDLRGNPPVQTHIIQSDNPPQLKLRPDVIGRQAFEAGAEQYFSTLSSRFDQLASSAQPTAPSTGSFEEPRIGTD